MQNQLYIVTGVASSGKSTIGQALADQLGIRFYDGDDFHPQSNIDKMKAGTPLTDDDRWPWLAAINDFSKEHLQKSSLVVCSSALKDKYRTVLAKDIPKENLHWIHLTGSFELIKKRMSQRPGHFMPESLLQSQFEAFEQPTEGLIINVDQTVTEIIQEIIESTSMNNLKEVGLIGLGVMGTSLARNIAGKGFTISIFNREVPGKEESIASKAKAKFNELSDAEAFNDLEAFVKSLALPRKIIVMVNAGSAVDAVIDSLVPLMQAGDIVIDAGNSHYFDTDKREKALSNLGFRYIGTGVSGGEEGALKGPSIMPGGSPEAFVDVEKILKSIAAKNENGEPCCHYVGKGGAGHFVKMVHNGIEYAEMQLIAEVYSYMRYGMGLDANDIAEVFETWNKGEASSYLLSITVDILRFHNEDGTLLLDQILDSAGNKGTGSWTTISACELGVPIPTITAALFARYQSSFKKSRQEYAGIYHGAHEKHQGGNLDTLENLLQFARIVNHHQGFDLIAQASQTYGWNIDLINLAITWSNGCIIRSALLKEIRIGMEQGAPEVLKIPALKQKIEAHYEHSLQLFSTMATNNIAVPCISSAIEYFKYLRTADSSANVIQAQRDFFGAHTYKLKSDPEGPSKHTIWEKE